MSLALHITAACPKCHKLTMQSVIEAHPNRRDIAIQEFYCAECGPVKSIVHSLKPGKPSPEVAA
jgi:hypothetical protein